MSSLLIYVKCCDTEQPITSSQVKGQREEKKTSTMSAGDKTFELCYDGLSTGDTPGKPGHKK